jgi:aspartate/methionine/tyrosine aminotransferase
MLTDFELKTFFSNDIAKNSKGTISASYAHLLTVDELLALEPVAKDHYLAQTLSYTQPNGSLALRSAIADYANAQNLSYSTTQALTEKHITITSGSDEAIFMVMDTVLSERPHAHVVVHSPIYQSLLTLPKKYGAQVSQWQAEESDGWQPSLDKLRELLRPNTCLVVVNFPHNPTGWHPNTEYIQALIRIVEEAGVLLVSDEVYMGLPMSNTTLFCLAGLSANVVSIGTMSKAFAMPGVRVGWTATHNEDFLARASRLHQYLNTYPAQPSEFLTKLALRHNQHILMRNNAIAKANFAELEAFLDEYPHIIEWHKPQAGVVCYPRWKGAGSTDDLCKALLHETGWLVAPSSRFLADDMHFRIGYGARSFEAWFPAFRQFMQKMT